MLAARQTKQSRRRRRGLMSLELLLTLPLLLLVLFALLEFGLLFFARSQLVQASRAAARQAALRQVVVEDIEAQVQQILGPSLQRGLQVYVQSPEQSGELVTVGIEVPMLSAAPDLLWPVGYSLQGRSLYAETTFVRE